MWPGAMIALAAAAGCSTTSVTVDSGDDCGDTDDVPQLLRCTGLYADVASRTIAADVIPYESGLTLWSDGADKRRYLQLPPGQVIDTSDMDEWRFPVGTKVWKEFRLGGVPIETRLLHKRGPTDWAWATYRWPAGEGDAVRIDDGARDVVGSYEIPSRADCKTCHDGRRDMILGIEAIATSLPSASGVTLAWLIDQRLLSVPPSRVGGGIPEDATGFARASLAYLHVSCGISCHNQNTGAEAFLSGFYARLPAGLLDGSVAVEELDAWTTAARVAPQSTAYAAQKAAGYQRLAPGDAARSLIIHVMGLRGAGQMPPIATHQIDTVGLELVSAWINARTPSEPSRSTK